MDRGFFAGPAQRSIHARTRAAIDTPGAIRTIRGLMRE